MRTTHVIVLVVASMVSSSLAHAQGAPSDSSARRRGMQDRHEMGQDHEMRGPQGWRRMGRGHAEMDGRGGMRGPLRGIALTDAEREKVKLVHEKYRAQGRALQDSLRPAMRAAHDAREKGDSAAARAAWDRGKADRDRMKALHERAMAEVRGALTAEHQTRFDTNVKEMEQRRAEWEKGGRDRRGRGRMQGRPGDER